MSSPAKASAREIFQYKETIMSIHPHRRRAVIDRERRSLAEKRYRNIRSRMVLEATQFDPQKAKTDVNRNSWKGNRFLRDLFWDLDTRYFSGYFKNNGWEESLVNYKHMREGLLGYFDSTSTLRLWCEGSTERKWFNPNTQCATITGINISSNFVFRTLHHLRDTLCHEMCHAWAHKELGSVEELIRNNDRKGHGFLWQGKIDDINRLSTGSDDFEMCQYADDYDGSTKGVDPRTLASFAYYYFDIDKSGEHVRAMKVDAPKLGFENIWTMMHYTRGAKAQDRLVLVYATDDFISSVVNYKYTDITKMIRTTFRGSGTTTADGFQTLSTGKSRGLYELIDKAEQLSYQLDDGTTVTPCKVIETWNFEDLA